MHDEDEDCVLSIQRVIRFGSLAAVFFCSALGIACTTVPLSADTPAVEVDGITLLESTDAGQRFLVTLVLKNPNSDPLVFRSIEFDLRLAGEGFIEGRTSDVIIVDANGERTIRVDVRSEFVSSISRLAAYLQGPESTLPYQIDGDLMLDTRPPRTMRFDASGRTPLIIVVAQ
jgi:LEA14-like dessication related protein